MSSRTAATSRLTRSMMGSLLSEEAGDSQDHQGGVVAGLFFVETLAAVLQPAVEERGAKHE
jgi:hypothetical protein